MMSPRGSSSFSVKDIQDDVGETFELEIIPEAKEQKRRKFVDHIVERNKVKSINDLNDIPKAMHHKDSGDTGNIYSRKLEEGKPPKGNHQPQPVCFLIALAASEIYLNAFACYIIKCSWNSCQLVR